MNADQFIFQVYETKPANLVQPRIPSNSNSAFNCVYNNPQNIFSNFDAAWLA